MASGTHSEQLREESKAFACDIGLRRILKEQLEGARAACSAPMALLSVDLLGSDIRIALGMNPELVDAIAESGHGTRLMIVDDVDNDPRVPATWIGQGIGASLSMPVCVDDRYIGSLHVVDSRSREWTDSEAEAITDIAYIIGKRLERFLGPEREERRESLMRRAVSPAFAELRNALVPLNLGTADLRMASADLYPVIQKIATSVAAEDEAAAMAYEDLVSLIEEISRASSRVREVVMVVEGLWGEGGRSVVLNDLLRSAAGLALHSTRLVGGVKMPEAPLELSIHARRSVAVAGLSLLLSRAAETNANGVTAVTPLSVELEIDPSWFFVRVRGENLNSEECELITLEVDMLLLGDRDMSVSVEDCEIAMRLTRRS